MSKLMNKIYIKGLQAKQKVCKLLKNESGEANIVAIILVLAIVIALAIIFKDALMDLFYKIWNSLFAEVDKVI